MISIHTSKRHCWHFQFIIAILAINRIVPPVLGQTTLSFCDGDDLFVVNEGECEGGINFGKRKPDCVCITGVYRSWTDNCDLFDGFLHQFCSPASDDDAYSLLGVKLIPGIANIYQDTAAVFGSITSDDPNWSAYPLGTEGWTKADSIYTLNGFPVLLFKGMRDRFICVEPQASPRGSQQVCKFFQDENKAVWMSPGGRMRVRVMAGCDPKNVTELEGYTVAQLREHKCYDIMDNKVSECTLPCERGPKARIPGSSYTSVFREKKSVNQSSAFPTPSSEEDSIPAPPISSTPSNANFDFHRKLGKHIRLRQVGHLKAPDISQVAPSRTFSLLELAKRIVRSAIPPYFVSSVFLDNALELFAVLHTGQNFRYGEDLQQRDFKWTEEILLKCRGEVLERPLSLQGDPNLPGCKHEGLITNVCFLSDGNFSICERTVGGRFHQEGKYHYVIDAVWNIIDLTHALCQPYFEPSYRMFHMWEQASEKLFTREIRNLWYKPEVNLRVYDAILAGQAVMNMVNLERATEGAYHRTTLPRLRRPPRQKLNFRRKRDTSTLSVAKTVDIFCAKSEKEFENNC